MNKSSTPKNALASSGKSTGKRVPEKSVPVEEITSPQYVIASPTKKGKSALRIEAKTGSPTALSARSRNDSEAKNRGPDSPSGGKKSARTDEKLSGSLSPNKFRRRQSYFRTGGLQRDDLHAEDKEDGAVELITNDVKEIEETWDSVDELYVNTDINKPVTIEGPLSTSNEDEDTYENPGRLIYAGSKFFWRVGQQIDINLYEAPLQRGGKPTKICISAYNATADIEYPLLFVDGDRVGALVRRGLDRLVPKIEGRKYLMATELQELRDQMLIKEKSKFILARLTLMTTPEGQEVIGMSKLSGDSEDGLVISGPAKLKNGIKRQRRSSLQAFIGETEQLRKDVEHLQTSVKVAEEKREAVRISLEAFTELHQNTLKMNDEKYAWSPSKKKWVDSINKMRLQNQVEETSKVLAKTGEFLRKFPAFAASSETIASIDIEDSD